MARRTPDRRRGSIYLGLAAGLFTMSGALVGGYVVEGHVPADVVNQLLKEKPAVAGLAVPGMPIGSPGMESADGNKQAYNVVSFDKAGKTQVYAVR